MNFKKYHPDMIFILKYVSIEYFYHVFLYILSNLTFKRGSSFVSIIFLTFNSKFHQIYYKSINFVQDSFARFHLCHNLISQQDLAYFWRLLYDFSYQLFSRHLAKFLQSYRSWQYQLFQDILSHCLSTYHFLSALLYKAIVWSQQMLSSHFQIFLLKVSLPHFTS